MMLSIGSDERMQPESISGQEALNILTKYLLGEDWYIVDPINQAQANTIIVDEILSKYSKKYKKEKKIREKNSKDGEEKWLK